MVDIPLLDDEYREAFFYLINEMNFVKSCSDRNQPWHPKNEEKLEWAFKVYKRWHPDPGKNPILDFPWPAPGEIPKVPDGFLKPTDGEKKKIQAFIDRHEGQEMNPLTEMIILLAKDLIQEVH
jgi:hypothetical protein